MPLPTPNNRVRESCSTTGTGNLACGGAPTGYKAFGDRYADGDRFKYCCAGGAEWEVGLGEYDADTNSIVRVTCSQSSAPADAFVNFTVGSKFVWVDRDAKDDPAIPGDATLFLNGATPPAYAAVKDSDLSTSDVTTNNVTSSKHGLAPKAPADATKFLNGAATPAFAQVKDSDLSTSDITTNDVSTTKHGFAPKAPNDATKYLDGTGAWSTIGAASVPAALKILTSERFI